MSRIRDGFSSKKRSNEAKEYWLSMTGEQIYERHGLQHLMSCVSQGRFTVDEAIEIVNKSYDKGFWNKVKRILTNLFG